MPSLTELQRKNPELDTAEDFLDRFGERQPHSLIARRPTPNHPTIAYFKIFFRTAGTYGNYPGVALEAVTKSGQCNHIDYFKFMHRVLWTTTAGPGWMMGGNHWVQPHEHSEVKDALEVVATDLQEAIDLIVGTT